MHSWSCSLTGSVLGVFFGITHSPESALAQLRALHEFARPSQGQVPSIDTRSQGGIGRGIWRALRDMHGSEGWRGLHRGLALPPLGGSPLVCPRLNLNLGICQLQSAPSTRQAGPCRLLNT